jgi:hypothetical protein
MTFASINHSINRSINRLALAAAVAFACLAAGGLAQAQTPGALAAAKELVALKGGNSMFDPLIPGVIERAKNSFVPTNPQLIGQLNQVAEQLKKEYASKSVDITNEVAKVYAQHFTEAELKEILVFYKSPVGRKMVTEEPKAIEQSLKAAQDWAAKFSDVVLERFRVEMKKKGYDL